MLISTADFCVPLIGTDPSRMAGGKSGSYHPYPMLRNAVDIPEMRFSLK